MCFRDVVHETSTLLLLSTMCSVVQSAALPTLIVWSEIIIIHDNTVHVSVGNLG